MLVLVHVLVIGSQSAVKMCCGPDSEWTTLIKVRENICASFPWRWMLICCCSTCAKLSEVFSDKIPSSMFLVKRTVSFVKPALEIKSLLLVGVKHSFNFFALYLLSDIFWNLFVDLTVQVRVLLWRSTSSPQTSVPPFLWNIDCLWTLLVTS